MLLCYLIAIIVSFIAFVISPLFAGLFKGSGILNRLTSHILFLPLYIIIYLFVMKNGYIILEYTVFSPSLVGFINGIILYILMLSVYEAVLGKVERSLSIDILVYLNGSLSKTKTLHEIINRFNIKQMISERLRGLRRHGFIDISTGTCYTTIKGDRGAKLILQAKSLFSNQQ